MLHPSIQLFLLNMAILNWVIAGSRIKNSQFKKSDFSSKPCLKFGMVHVSTLNTYFRNIKRKGKVSCTFVLQIKQRKKINFYLQFSLGYFAPKFVKGLGWVSHEIPNCNIPPVPKVSLHSFHSCHYWGFWNERGMSLNSELGSFSETSSSSDERNILRRKCDTGNWDQAQTYSYANSIVGKIWKSLCNPWLAQGQCILKLMNHWVKKLFI